MALDDGRTQFFLVRPTCASSLPGLYDEVAAELKQETRHRDGSNSGGPSRTRTPLPKWVRPEYIRSC